jgi:CheY-like chemotaxis protein
MGVVIEKSIEIEKIPSLRILVADDDELGRRLMRVILTHEGHYVEVAANGLEALESVKQHKYDIVFMDLHMPDMDGLEASRQIRAWEDGRGSHTFIVALTASYLPEIGQALFDAGMDNYISKPFEVSQIQRLLKYASPASH